MTSKNENPSKQIAILVENEFEDVNFKIPNTALKQAGAIVTVLGARMNDDYKGHHGTLTVTPDATPAEVNAEDFDAFILLGGSNRVNPNVVTLIQNAIALNKWIVAIGFGPQILIETGQLTGKQVTGFRAIRTDLENAGATYIDTPTAVDSPIITARRPGDLPILMTTLFRVLEISITRKKLPLTNHLESHEWWALGESWGGSSRLDIVKALDTAIIGERYTLEQIKQYSYRARSPELVSILTEIVDSKHKHIQQLQDRLHSGFGELVAWQALGGEALAVLQSWLQSSNETSIIRRTLGDLQTGMVDAYRLCNQLSDPLSAEIFDRIASDLSNYEQRLAALYRSHSPVPTKPPMPTTVSVMH
ncbi:DJ-1/PfpI family [Synechococcus sp. PCC 7335]|uniref:DJ-1/PfpI family protein n=1 Tax=Synechococcus sp. (strain ATCC 29403 / PCC 7335) TaxID=91464 RepID=UPI00017ECEBE|nr:DJ-1/PfpI family protein [Synechococcus sp. PCC 7335]EDX87616.1 DJ-1/PfpI family [Synechococcus sp. PCC 7335]